MKIHIYARYMYTYKKRNQAPTSGFQEKWHMLLTQKCLEFSVDIRDMSLEEARRRAFVLARPYDNDAGIRRNRHEIAHYYNDGHKENKCTHALQR